MQYGLVCVTLCLVMAIHHVEAAETVRLFAAGSLRAAMTDIGRAFTTQYGVPVETTFGPWRLAVFILAPEGQQILTQHGFISGALPSKGP